MGLIEPLTLSAAALPSSVLRLDSALLLSVPLVSALSVAASWALVCAPAPSAEASQAAAAAVDGGLKSSL